MQTYTRNDVALAISLVGIITAIALVCFGDTRDLDYVWIGRIGVVILAGPGAYFAGLLCGPMFGIPGKWGWLAAAIGAAMSTICGAMIAGTFAVPLLGTFIAPLVLIAEGLHQPLIALIWCASMIGLQVILLKSVD